MIAKVVSLGCAKFRASQLRDWVYIKGETSPDKMTNLSKQDRIVLSQYITIFSSATITREQRSSDGTIKLLLTWPNGSSAETVMIPDADRHAACVGKPQVGCPVGCTFCASGINGVKGNLTAGQIVEQVVVMNRVLKGSKLACFIETTVVAPTITNIVFMGMGEPLANYANVMKAIHILHDTTCLNLGARRITISTVGVPPKMRELANEELPLNLAISLHAPNEQLRRQLIPWARTISRSIRSLMPRGTTSIRRAVKSRWNTFFFPVVNDRQSMPATVGIDLPDASRERQSDPLQRSRRPAIQAPRSPTM